MSFLIIIFTHHSILQESIMQSSVNSINNNFNNNNDFGSTNNDALDNAMTQQQQPPQGGASTLISFDGMNSSSGANNELPLDVSSSSTNNLMDNAVDLLNFSQQQTDNASNPDLLGERENMSGGAGASPNNSIISNPLQGS